MSILHTVNKSPFHKGDLVSCLNHANDEDAVLMIEDGVYGAMTGTSASDAVSNAKAGIFVLGADLAARGISEDKVADGITIVGYDGFVDLAAEHSAVNSWL